MYVCINNEIAERFLRALPAGGTALAQNCWPCRQNWPAKPRKAWPCRQNALASSIDLLEKHGPVDKTALAGSIDPPRTTSRALVGSKTALAGSIDPPRTTFRALVGSIDPPRTTFRALPGSIDPPRATFRTLAGSIDLPQATFRALVGLSPRWLVRPSLSDFSCTGLLDRRRRRRRRR